MYSKFEYVEKHLINWNNTTDITYSNFKHNNDYVTNRERWLTRIVIIIGVCIAAADDADDVIVAIVAAAVIAYCCAAAAPWDHGQIVHNVFWFNLMQSV